MEGLWDKGVFKKWNRLGLLKNDRVKDYLQNFSPTPGIVIVRIIISIVATDDLELHSIDIEKAFLQSDKLMEAVNDRYFINPPPGRPDTNNKSS